MYFLLAAFLPGWQMRWARMTLFSLGQPRDQRARQKTSNGRAFLLWTGTVSRRLSDPLRWHLLPPESPPLRR